MYDRQAVQIELEARVSGLGYDLVQVIWAGSPRRPVVRLRIERQRLDRPVSLDDCARVSRQLEPWLDRAAGVPEKYVLEVSSPGVDRPLTRARDFERFRGCRVAVKEKTWLVVRPDGRRAAGSGRPRRRGRDGPDQAQRRPRSRDPAV